MLNIFIILMLCLGFGCIFFAIDCFRDTSKKYKTAANIIYGLGMLSAGLIMIAVYGFMGSELDSSWVILISILISSYLYFFFSKTKIWKNRHKAKKPIEEGFNLILGMIGLGIILFGVGHIFFAIIVWLKDGVWKTISLGYWFNLGRFDTGFIGLNKILNFVILDISATLPLIAIGFFIYAASRDY
tara:strand:- start:273 stop:830 length:558 start_codon:yes stop_codon:yes gene_type:complete